MDLQSTFDIPEICHQYGITDAVISPGSRNAALTIAFARHPKIRCYSVPDERSAAFIALGMSLKNKVPTVLICTSGSAGLNYAPAVAEAYFNQVPLLILTADRPPELIGKRDGQTIHQQELYGRHAKGYFGFPSFEENLNVAQSCLEEAIQLSMKGAPGPVQVNIPFQEPFYPEKDKAYQARKEINCPPLEKQSDWIFESKLEEIKTFKRILLIVGQGAKDEKLIELLNQLSEKLHIPIIADVISNAHEVIGCIQHQDLFLIYGTDELKPDLIISFGLSVISKNLKLYLRKQTDVSHWHITPNDDAADTYNHLSQTVDCQPEVFLDAWLLNASESGEEQMHFRQNWQSANRQAQVTLDNIDSSAWNESSIYQQIMKSLPQNLDLHLANSMAVRYANVMSLKKQNVEVYCNRGTSGIDGSNSTAVGTCIASGNDTLLLTGDVAFLYDRNAFWHNHLPENLNIILFNNQGGNIFRMIQGPSEQPELKQFFETDQRSTAEHLSREFNFQYLTASSPEELEKALPKILDFSGQRSIFEIITHAEGNKTAYKLLFKKMRELGLSH